MLGMVDTVADMEVENMTPLTEIIKLKIGRQDKHLHVQKNTIQ